MPENVNSSKDFGTAHVDAPMAAPPVTEIASTDAPKPALDNLGDKNKNENLHFNNSDVIHIIFFTGALAGFFFAIRYFINRKDVLLNWQNEANEDLIKLKGSLNNLTKKVSTLTQTNQIQNEGFF
ncbi:MAG: hypothetical protein ACRDE2_00120 [Chitinophagaceae bacterium]